MLANTVFKKYEVPSMIFNAPVKKKRKKHACIHMFLGVKGSEEAFISELWASLRKDNQEENGRQESQQRATFTVLKNILYNRQPKVETRDNYNNRGKTEKQNE